MKVYQLMALIIIFFSFSLFHDSLKAKYNLLSRSINNLVDLHLPMNIH